MKDPYKILGVSKYDSDERIKEVYKELAKKYHPDNYVNNPLADLASEKMQEINEAYDTIMNERKGYKKANNRYGSSNFSANGNMKDVRTLIMNNQINDAEQILNSIPESSRNAEWNFLKGTIFYKRGWAQEAYNSFSIACSMDPGNAEYAAAYNELDRQRNGDFGRFQTNSYRQGGCTPCDVCTGLICMDCMCDCFRCC